MPDADVHWAANGTTAMSNMTAQALAAAFIALWLRPMAAEADNFGVIQSPDYIPRPNVCGYGFRQKFDTGKCEKITHLHCHGCDTDHLEPRH